MTSEGPTNEKTPENRGSVDSCQALASAVTTGGWAVQAQNTPSKPTEKQQISETGAVKSAAFQGDSFAEAVASIMRLPLSDAEKAEAVRRLLAVKGDGQ